MPRNIAASSGSSEKMEILKPIFWVGATYRPLERSRLRTGRSVSQTRPQCKPLHPAEVKKVALTVARPRGGSCDFPLDGAIRVDGAIRACRLACANLRRSSNARKEIGGVEPLAHGGKFRGRAAPLQLVDVRKEFRIGSQGC